MPIRVTCTSCHTRFNVSDKFAGKEGPCPKCKTTIQVPEKEQEVVIAVPDDAPKDSKGRSILKPIKRRDTTLSSVQITLIAVAIIGFLLVALLLRLMSDGDPSQVPSWIVYVAAIVVAPPCAMSPTHFLETKTWERFSGANYGTAF
jgi:hypothetical protein